MRLYDRAEEKRIVLVTEQLEDKLKDTWDFSDDYDMSSWSYCPYYGPTNLGDVRKGWLMWLLLKLNLKSPTERIWELNW